MISIGCYEKDPLIMFGSRKYNETFKFERQRQDLMINRDLDLRLILGWPYYSGPESQASNRRKNACLLGNFALKICSL